MVPTQPALPASPGAVVVVPSARAGRHLLTRFGASKVADHQSHQRVSPSPHMYTLAGAPGQVVVCGARRLYAPTGGVGGRQE